MRVLPLFLDTLPEPTFIVNKEGIITFFNKAYEALQYDQPNDDPGDLLLAADVARRHAVTVTVEVQAEILVDDDLGGIPVIRVEGR